MIENPMDVLRHYEIRKSKKQKTAFITAVTAFFQRSRYGVRVEKGSFGSRNIVVGNPDTAQYLVTAHYDTCAWMPFPNLITPTNPFLFILYQLALVVVIFGAAIGIGVGAGILFNDPALAGAVAMLSVYVMLGLMLFGPANRHTANDNTSGVVTVLTIAESMPENLRDRVCFVLFDLEEAGLIGSASYRKAHKRATEKQIVLNLDCVGDGDEILLFPSKKLKKQPEKLDKLRKICEKMKTKSIALREKGFSYYPSDQTHFPYGVGIAAFRRKKGVGLYCGRIHTGRDTVLEQTNVNILRAAIISLIGAP